MPCRELGAGMLVPRHSRYAIDLNRPPENTPMLPARTTPSSAGRTSSAASRSIGHRSPTKRPRSNGAAPPTGSPTTTRSTPSSRASGRARPRHPVGRAQHQVRVVLAVRRAGCPDLNLGTAGGASCTRPARRSWRCWRGRATSATSPTAASGRAHHPPLRAATARHPCDPARMCWSCYIGRGAAVRHRAGAGEAAAAGAA